MLEKLKRVFRKKKEFPFRPQQVTLFFRCPENPFPRGKAVIEGVLVAWSPDGTLRIRFTPSKAGVAGRIVRSIREEARLIKISVVAVYEKELR